MRFHDQQNNQPSSFRIKGSGSGDGTGVSFQLQNPLSVKKVIYHRPIVALLSKHHGYLQCGLVQAAAAAAAENCGYCM
jgi:hypothetical protein